MFNPLPYLVNIFMSLLFSWSVHVCVHVCVHGMCVCGMCVCTQLLTSSSHAGGVANYVGDVVFGWG